MKKQNFVATMLGTVGGIFFALGMVMCLVTQWKLMTVGIVLGAVGLVVLLSILPIWRKLSGKAPLKTDKKVLIAYIIGVVGTLLLGTGMSLTMLNTEIVSMCIVGIVLGIVGIVICIMNYPIYKGIKK